MKNLKYTDILKKNKILENSVSKYSPYGIRVFSNIITSQFNEILEYVLRKENINARVASGEYDNILQDSIKYSSESTIIIFWELSNLISGFQYKADIMDFPDVKNLIEKTKNEIDFVFRNLSATPNVIINRFSSTIFNYSFLRQNSFETIGNELNEHLKNNLPPNFTLVDIDKIFAKISVEKSVDLRYYYSSKALYSVEFYKEYSNYISPIIFSLLGRTKKALILDCDNTLWKGVVGEDGLNGISLSEKDKNGIIFEEIHSLIQALSKRGIIIGLCSKNNPEDVEEVFSKRKDFRLKENDILIKKINWRDKVANLRDIASELDIGVDSLVYIDDSPFETNLIRQNLSEVTTLEVSNKLYCYPSMVREKLRLFYKKNITKEDEVRATYYKIEKGRKIERNKFDTLGEYLATLNLIIRIYINDRTLNERVAQLSQKTNQFNLTTHRVTKNEIELMLESGNHRIYAFGVEDKFGDYGITGTAIIRFENGEAYIDNLLMSCRVIGRDIEITFLNYILTELRDSGIKLIHSSYIRTNKNVQVDKFYEDFGFLVDRELDDEKKYLLNLSQYENKTVEYITLKNVK